jgi:hypothetical protein
MEAQAHPCRLLACLRCAGACRAATHGTSRRVPPASTSWLTHLRSGRGSADSSLTPAWTPGKQQLTAKGQDRGQSTGRTASGREQACRCPCLWSHACLHSHPPPACLSWSGLCLQGCSGHLPARLPRLRHRGTRLQRHVRLQRCEWHPRLRQRLAAAGGAAGRHGLQVRESKLLLVSLLQLLLAGPPCHEGQQSEAVVL